MIANGAITEQLLRDWSFGIFLVAIIFVFSLGSAIERLASWGQRTTVVHEKCDCEKERK
jgi:hypothetical protein